MLQRLKRFNFPKITGLLSSANPELEMNLAAYGFGVLVCAVVLWRWESTGPRDMSFVAAFTAYLGAITGGLFKKGSNAPAATPQPGAPDKEANR
jgi:hypothetical protein